MTGINAAELRNVCKVRKDFKIDNVSFKLPSGTITGFVGENGAGKTTVIELILDIIKRDSGEILVFGMDNITHRSEIHEDIGVVFDTVKFPDTLTACDLNKIMSGIYKNWDEDEFVGYCARFALPIDKKFARFSRGMTMKLSLAAAFSHKAKLLILDEPTGGLDPAARNEILDIIQEFVCDEEHTVLFSSHIIGDLERIADRIVFIRGGRIIFSEDTIELSETRALQLDHVDYAYGAAKILVLSDVSADFESGKMYAITGPSGAGKSTLLSLLAGLDAPSRGVVRFEGKDIAASGYAKHRREHVSLVFQDHNLIDYLTPEENPRLVSTKADMKILEELGLSREESKRNIMHLSGGQRQRVAVGRALVAPGRAILADEPTGSLDPEMTDEVIHLLQHAAHQLGKCVIVVTHSKRVANSADVVLRLRSKKLTRA